jgi:hypothetical protein
MVKHYTKKRTNKSRKTLKVLKYKKRINKSLNKNKNKKSNKNKIKKQYSRKGGSAKRPLTEPELFQSEKIQRQMVETPVPIDENLLVDTTNRAINVENAIPQSDLDKLLGLGFEDGELEMLFSEFGNKTNELIDKYLEISKEYPGYETLDEAINSEYTIPNTDLTKHDIAEQVLSSYYE